MGAYGWKATIGIIVPPQTNETVNHDEGLSYALADCMTRATMETSCEAAWRAGQKAPRARGIFIFWPVVQEARGS